MAGAAEVDYEEPLNAVNSPNRHVLPLKVQVLLDECEATMELDTWASRSIMSERVFKCLWPMRKLQPANLKLHRLTQNSHW